MPLAMVLDQSRWKLRFLLSAAGGVLAVDLSGICVSLAGCVDDCDSSMPDMVLYYLYYVEQR